MKKIRFIEVPEEMLSSIVQNSVIDTGPVDSSTQRSSTGDVISQKELCKRLGITEATAINLKNKGIISPFGSLGRKVYYNWENVLAQMKKAHI
jgi:hypothetical protein